MRSEKGAVAENLKAIEVFVREADKRGIDILGLPEACITGYNNPLKFPEAVLDLHGPEIASLLQMTALPRKGLGKKPTVLAGLIETNPGNKPFLTHIAVHDGKITGRCRKHITKDETSDWFSSANEINVFEYEGLKYGISICADIEYEGLFKEYARQGVKFVFELAAPGLYGEQTTRNWETGYAWWEGVCRTRFEKYTKKYGLWIAVATAAGRTSDEDFPGGGYLFAPDGTRVFATKDWNPCEVYLEIDLESGTVKQV